MLGFRVHSFDIATNSYTPACARLLGAIWPDRFHFHAGDSQKTLPGWSLPGGTCDVISIDGRHEQQAVKSDLRYFAKWARPQAACMAPRVL